LALPLIIDRIWYLTWCGCITGVSSIIEVKKCDSKVPVLAAMDLADVVHEEIHLFGTDLFKLILEGVYSFDVDCTVRQTVSSIRYTDREEVKSCIACTVSCNQFPSVATSVSSIS